MSKYSHESPMQILTGGLLTIAAVATMPVWLPIWMHFCQWALSAAFTLGALIWS